MAEKPLLIVDCENLCHRARHVNGMLAYKGTPTGVLYGFLNQLYTIVQFAEPQQIIFAWDSRKSKRKKLFPGYKDRDTLMDDVEVFYGQVNALRDVIMPGLGLRNNFQFDGYEADDIIAQAVRQCSRYGTRMIVSSDNDLLQCLGPNTSVYNVARKKIYTFAEFLTDYNISPEEWPKVKAIAGCTSDTIPGVTNVGVKTAIRYLKGNLTGTEKVYPALKAFERSPEYRRNLKLTTLPFVDTVVFPKLPVLHPMRFRLRWFKKLCKQYGFKRWIKDNDWEVYFEEG